MSTLDILAKSGEAAKSGPIGFAVILVLCVVCYFLFRSMSKHLKTVRERFPAVDKTPKPAGRADRISLDKPSAKSEKDDTGGSAAPPG
jgi:hypothetical protein